MSQINPVFAALYAQIVEDITSKQCTKCNKNLPRSAFYPRREAKSGLYSICKDCWIKATKKWKKNNKENVRQIRKKYEQTDKFKQIRRKKIKKRLAADPKFKMLRVLRCRLRNVLNGTMKAASTQELLGCDMQFFKDFTESKFKPGMNWQNHGSGDGKWQIDHILPCSSFDLSDGEQQKKCFHYTNMQPLWAHENLQKSNKLDWKPADEQS